MILINKLKCVIKNIYLKNIYYTKYFINALFGKLQCPICDKRIIKFNNFSEYYIDKWFRNHFIHSIFAFETLNILQSSCPFCRAGDSFRLYALYLKKKLGKTNGKITFIEFAPAEPITRLIRSYKNINYRSADLYMGGVDDKVDLTNMPIYKDNSIDMFMCTHVLEHIANDQKAINELYRILKPGGEAIIQVPILMTMENDYENSLAKSEAERWKYFGQGDHLRIYSKKGFVNKLESAGFEVNQLGINYFGKEIFNKCGITDLSVLYIVKK